MQSQPLNLREIFSILLVGLAPFVLYHFFVEEIYFIKNISVMTGVFLIFALPLGYVINALSHIFLNWIFEAILPRLKFEWSIFLNKGIFKHIKSVPPVTSE